MATCSEGFAIYFARFAESPLLLTYHESLDERLFVSGPDDRDVVQWRPKLATAEPDWGAMEPFLASPVREYFSSTWFLFAGGAFGKHGIMLDPIAPKYFKYIKESVIRLWDELEFEKRSWLPIGWEGDEANRLVLANSENKPVVAVQDVHNGAIEAIADSPFKFLSELVPSSDPM